MTFIGLAVMILMIPLNGVVAQKMKKYQVSGTKLLKNLFQKFEWNMLDSFIKKGIAIF